MLIFGLKVQAQQVTSYATDVTRTLDMTKGQTTQGVSKTGLPEIQINPSIRYQEIDGFGAAITGSTAYNLSNGGPIIVPGTGVMLMTAVAPHSLNIRPIVIPDKSVVTFDVESRSHSFLVAIDGRSERLREGIRLTLRRAPYNIRVVKRSGKQYFSTLREKMMWGADQR